MFRKPSCRKTQLTFACLIVVVLGCKSSPNHADLAPRPVRTDFGPLIPFPPNGILLRLHCRKGEEDTFSYSTERDYSSESAKTPDGGARHRVISATKHARCIEATKNTFLWAFDTADKIVQGYPPEQNETMLRDKSYTVRLNELGWVEAENGQFSMGRFPLTTIFLPKDRVVVGSKFRLEEPPFFVQYTVKNLQRYQGEPCLVLIGQYAAGIPVQAADPPVVLVLSVKTGRIVYKESEHAQSGEDFSVRAHHVMERIR